MPLAAPIDNGYGQGRFKNVNKAWLRVFRSSGIFVGPDAEKLTEAKQRTTEPLRQPARTQKRGNPGDADALLGRQRAGFCPAV